MSIAKMITFVSKSTDQFDDCIMREGLVLHGLITQSFRFHLVTTDFFLSHLHV